MKQKTGKNTLLKLVLTMLTLGSLLSASLFWQEMNRLNLAYADLNRIEFISSSTQRLLRTAESDAHLQKDIFFIGDATNKALYLEADNQLSVLEKAEIAILSFEVVESWQMIESILSVDGTVNKVDMRLAGDSHFKAMTDLSNGITAYTEEHTRNINTYQLLCMGQMFAIAVVTLHNLLQTKSELKLSQKIASEAQIDTATGLFNRSRCQDLFKANNSPNNKKHPAIMVLDLNDLKQTNDSLGHRMGDELIVAFSKALKESCQVHLIPPFIGRYGGDEFIVFYHDLGAEEEIHLYLKELKFHCDRFNERETRFQISYAVGYAYVTLGLGEKMTVRELFDQADAAMFQNKIAIKQAKDPNYQPPRNKDDR